MKGTKLTVKRMCQIAQVSRAGYYRHCQRASATLDKDRELRAEIRKIVSKWPVYGTRRVTAELRHRDWTVNRKRVQRLMREENLLCRHKRKFVATTDSDHDLPVHPNLAPEMSVTGINQLWVADITYIWLEDRFVYLAVVMDACSRRVIGWELDQTLDARLAVVALEMARRRRSPAPGLVHHSDRGVQYASNDYTKRLEDNQITISMSRKATPWDNASCESFMKTLKYEEVYRADYQNLADARARIGRFIEKIYNQQRLHSALGYRSPVAFERDLLAPPAEKPNARPTE